MFFLCIVQIAIYRNGMREREGCTQVGFEPWPAAAMTHVSLHMEMHNPPTELSYPRVRSLIDKMDDR